MPSFCHAFNCSTTTDAFMDLTPNRLGILAEQLGRLGHDMHRPMPDPRYIKAITTNPALDTSFIMMESFGISIRKSVGLSSAQGDGRAELAREPPFRYAADAQIVDGE